MRRRGACASWGTGRSPHRRTGLHSQMAGAAPLCLCPAASRDGAPFRGLLRILDFDRDGVDAAVRFGVDVSEDLYSEKLVRDWVTPMAVPEVAERLSSPENLLRETLIHDESLSAFSSPDWALWLREAGVEGDPPRGGPRFSQADHALDAALSASGVVLGRAALAEQDLRLGRLVAPFRLGLEPKPCYHFVCPPGAQVGAAIRALRRLAP